MTGREKLTDEESRAALVKERDEVRVNAGINAMALGEALADVARLTEALGRARAEKAQVELQAQRENEAYLATNRCAEASEREAERWQACAEGLKSDLESAEQQSEYLRIACERLEGERNAAEARCRELEAACKAFEQAALQATADASGYLFELAQLRERVRQAVVYLESGLVRYADSALEALRGPK